MKASSSFSLLRSALLPLLGAFIEKARKNDDDEEEGGEKGEKTEL
jgi:hypothetical protein